MRFVEKIHASRWRRVHNERVCMRRRGIMSRIRPEERSDAQMANKQGNRRN